MNVPGNFHFFISFFKLNHLHWVSISFMIMKKAVLSWKKKGKIYKQHEIKFDRPPPKPEECACLWPSGFTFGISPKEIIWSAHKAEWRRNINCSSINISRIANNLNGNQGNNLWHSHRMGCFYTILEIFEDFVLTWEICLCHNSKWKARWR